METPHTCRSQTERLHGENRPVIPNKSRLYKARLGIWGGTDARGRDEDMEEGMEGTGMET
jgi:hypothetical protein